MADSPYNNFPASLGNVTFGANIGVGTMTPVVPADIRGGFNSMPAGSGTNPAGVGLRMQSNTNMLLDFGSHNTSLANWIQSRDASNYAYNYALLLNPNGGNVGVGGNLGIGTRTPVAPVDISGVFNSLPATSGTNPAGVGLRMQSNTNMLLDLGSANSPVANWIQSRDASNYALNYALLLNPNGGNVGIGMTTAPTGKLHIYGGANTDAYQVLGVSAAYGTDGLNIGHGGASFGPGGSFLNAHATIPGNAKLHLMVNGSTKLTVTDSGKVGIGTANPLFPLHVIGDLRVEGDVISNGAPPPPVAHVIAQRITLVGLTDPSQLRVNADGPIRAALGIYSPSSSFGFRRDGGNALPVEVGSLVVSDAYGLSPSLGDAYIKGSIGIGMLPTGAKLDIDGSIRATGGAEFNSNVTIKQDLTVRSGIYAGTGNKKIADGNGCYYA